MKKRLREILVKLLIFVPIIGNVICANEIQSLKSELEKERNPSFEQAKQKLYTEIRFTDWYFFEAIPNVKYWSTWNEALENAYKCYSNGKLSVVTHVGINNNLYMGLWEAKNETCNIKSQLSLIAGGTFELNASLPEKGYYVIGINYK